MSSFRRSLALRSRSSCLPFEPSRPDRISVDYSDSDEIGMNPRTPIVPPSMGRPPFYTQQRKNQKHPKSLPSLLLILWFRFTLLTANVPLARRFGTHAETSPVPPKEGSTENDDSDNRNRAEFSWQLGHREDLLDTVLAKKCYSHGTTTRKSRLFALERTAHAEETPEM